MTSEQIHIGNMSHETAIGILKLMLEAMETYDGISPTPARINAIKMAIEALEQEPQKFKWCTNCRECDQEKHCCHRWSKVIRNTVEEMKQGRCDKCEVGNPCLYCKHGFEPQESED